MSISSSIVSVIQSLECFNSKLTISPIFNGLSHTCYKARSHSKTYFIKRLNPSTTNAEVFSLKAIFTLDPHSTLSAKVIYADEHWLVTDFIDGELLINAPIAEDDKISIALSLIARLHRLTAVINSSTAPFLNPHENISKQIERLPANSDLNSAILTKVANELTKHLPSITTTKNGSYALCHGDVNFTNIINDKQGAATLIDFECSSIAPKEFDIAMLIAVNNISPNKIIEIINRYITLSKTATIDECLLSYYLLYSYFLNGLWYLASALDLDRERDNNTYLKLAQQQWLLFDDYVKSRKLPLTSLVTLYQFD